MKLLKCYQNQPNLAVLDKKAAPFYDLVKPYIERDFSQNSKYINKKFSAQNLRLMLDKVE